MAAMIILAVRVPARGTIRLAAIGPALGVTQLGLRPRSSGGGLGDRGTGAGALGEEHVKLVAGPAAQVHHEGRTGK